MNGGVVPWTSAQPQVGKPLTDNGTVRDVVTGVIGLRDNYYHQITNEVLDVLGVDGDVAVDTLRGWLRAAKELDDGLIHKERCEHCGRFTNTNVSAFWRVLCYPATIDALTGPDEPDNLDKFIAERAAVEPDFAEALRVAEADGVEAYLRETGQLPPSEGPLPGRSTPDITDSSPFAPTPPPSGGAASPRVHAEPPKHVVPGDNSDTGGGS